MIDNILGLGCDILEVARLESLLRKGREVFIKRVLTPAEIDEYERRSDKSAIRGNPFYRYTLLRQRSVFKKPWAPELARSFHFRICRC